MSRSVDDPCSLLVIQSLYKLPSLLEGREQIKSQLSSSAREYLKTLPQVTSDFPRHRAITSQTPVGLEAPASAWGRVSCLDMQ